MLSYTTMGMCVLWLTLATIFVMVLVVHHERTGKGVGAPALLGLIGILLGAGGAAAVVQLGGYELIVAQDLGEPSGATPAGGGGPGAPGESMMGGMSPPGGGPMGGPGGMMGPGGGMGGSGGFGGPNPKRDLTSLVRKIDLLTGDIALQLSDEQKTKIAEIVQRLNAAETLSDDEATQGHTDLLAVLTDEQKARQEAIGLPFRRRGGGGGFGGPPDPTANPFAQEENRRAADSLLNRFVAEKQ